MQTTRILLIDSILRTYLLTVYYVLMLVCFYFTLIVSRLHRTGLDQSGPVQDRIQSKTGQDRSETDAGLQSCPTVVLVLSPSLLHLQSSVLSSVLASRAERLDWTGLCITTHTPTGLLGDPPEFKGKRTNARMFIGNLEIYFALNPARRQPESATCLEQDLRRSRTMETKQSHRL